MDACNKSYYIVMPVLWGELGDAMRSSRMNSDTPGDANSYSEEATLCKGAKAVHHLGMMVVVELSGWRSAASMVMAVETGVSWAR
eukprot:2931851-Pleurochrysis_carterae.AAC.1